MTRTVTIQPDVRRSSSIRPQPRLRVTCPTYIGDQRNERGLTIRDTVNALIEEDGGLGWDASKVRALIDLIDLKAREDYGVTAQHLGLGVTVA